MRKTRELILQTALCLFAQRGFEGVSVRDIAGELELTAPALYVHFKSKQEILEAILRRMEERDAELSEKDNVPSAPLAESPESYDQMELSNLMTFTMDMFRHWTEDAFAVQFRHLLTIEQYHDKRFVALFQQYLGQGVIQYLEDIFHANYPQKDAHQLALSFYSPMFFLIGQHDAATTKKAKAAVVLALKKHIQEFMDRLRLDA
ncbi:MAG: TetR/AcrR family transcriptional regulator [Victivallales bacterium]|nr:TetR/AcrR family transcriptional regulator [Victivallales bacterium]